MTSSETQNDHHALQELVDLSIHASTASAHLVEVAQYSSSIAERSQVAAGFVQSIAGQFSQVAANVYAVEQGAHAVQEKSQRGIEAARQAVSSINDIALVVEKATGQIRELAAESKKIEKLVKEIEAVARQTNLLALNANIEAARAGEAGLGFGVVAREVKDLAIGTGRSAEDIRARLSALQDEIAAIVAIVDSGQVAVDSSRAVISESGEIAKCISDTATIVASGISEVSTITQQQCFIFEEVSSASSEVASAAVENSVSAGKAVAAMQFCESSLAAQLAALGESADVGGLILKAKLEHSDLRKQIVSVLCGATQLSPRDVPDGKSCHFGIFCESPEAIELRSHPAFAAFSEAHEVLHQQARLALEHYQINEMEQSRLALAAFDAGLERVFMALDSLLADRG